MELLEQHNHNCSVYTFEGQAYQSFAEAHDALVRQKMKAVNEDEQGILAKARGYTARLAMILHCLEQAVSRASGMQVEAETWSVEITDQAVKNAAAIIQHFNQQKLIMLGLQTDSTRSISSRLVRLLTIPTKSADGILQPSEVAQKHISEKVGQSYPIAKAVELMHEASDLGFGELETVMTPNNRQVKQFRKRPLQALDDHSKELLKKAKISDSRYNQAFNQECRRPLSELQNMNT